MLYYTITGKTDGFGAQYMAVMSGIAFCKYNNYIYVHTPFTQMEHDVDINKLNLFIGINNDHLIINNLLPINNNIIANDYSKEVLYSNNPNIYYTDQVINILQDYYYSTEKPIIENIDIAIHIRRGDVTKQKLQFRYTSNEIYNKIIKSLKTKYPLYNITIFSEGNYNDFKDLEINQNNLKLNIDIIETFHSLVSAKILVMAKSSFSYSAGILNKNIIYYEDFWHKPLNNWLNISSLINN